MVPLRVLQVLAFLGSFVPWARRKSATLRARRSALDRLAHWANIYSPYSDVLCRYRSDRMWKVFDGLSEDDRKTFDFDLRDLDFHSWRGYGASRLQR